MRIVHVLDDFRANYDIEWPTVQAREIVVVSRENFEPPLRISPPRDLNAISTFVNPDNGAAFCQKYSHSITVTAADIEDTRLRRQASAQLQQMGHKMPVHMRGVGIAPSVRF